VAQWVVHLLQIPIMDNHLLQEEGIRRMVGLGGLQWDLAICGGSKGTRLQLLGPTGPLLLLLECINEVVLR